MIVRDPPASRIRADRPLRNVTKDLYTSWVSTYLYTMTNEVRSLRESRGLSQGQLAQELRVSRQTINAIETGRYLPSLPLALALARFFDTAVEEMFHPDSGDLP